MPTSIVIIDDHAMFRESIAEMLDRQPDLVVTAQAGTGERGLMAVAESNPDVVLLDVEIPGSDVEKLIEGIRQSSELSRIAVLTMHEDADLVGRLIAVGVQAYISKGSSMTDLIAAIRAIASGRDRVIISVSRGAVSGLREPEKNPLSVREVEVLSLVRDGFGNAQIASRLFISEGTVKRHLTNIYTKLDVRSRVNAINRANELGLLRPSAGGSSR
ncbi:MAG: response regulator [Streptosporangiaceae bacterium]